MRGLFKNFAAASFVIAASACGQKGGLPASSAPETPQGVLPEAVTAVSLRAVCDEIRRDLNFALQNKIWGAERTFNQLTFQSSSKEIGGFNARSRAAAVRDFEDIEKIVSRVVKELLDSVQRASRSNDTVSAVGDCVRVLDGLKAHPLRNKELIANEDISKVFRNIDTILDSARARLAPFQAIPVSQGVTSPKKLAVGYGSTFIKTLTPS